MDFVFSGNIAQGTNAGLTGGPNNSCMFIGNFVPGSDYSCNGWTKICRGFGRWKVAVC
jgi:hypothetical protein